MNLVSSEIYDAVIIGAGPAGSLAALQLARAGKKVLLLDKAHFPRSKVCGCCINQSAGRVLQRSGLDAILLQTGAVPLKQLQLFDGTLNATVEVPGGHALSREYFDVALIDAAVAAGAQFLPGVAAKVCQSRIELSRVQIAQHGLPAIAQGLEQVIEARITIVADGLNGHALDQLPQFASSVAAKARFGCGTTIAPSSSINSYYRPGRIYMACHQGGYVGLVILENHAIDIACALDRSFVRQQESLPSAVAAVLAQCQLPLPVPAEQFACSHWHGTDALTRKRSKISGQRIFVIGDACGYPEPLTGEGIAWALESAEAVVPLALAAIDSWGDDLSARWQQMHGRLVSKRQLKSRLIAYSLRNPLSRWGVLQAISIFPLLAQAVAASLTHQPKQSVASK